MGFVSGNHVLLFIVFLVIVLVVFGPGKLPDVGAGMGRAMHEFRKASAEVKETVLAGGQPSATPMPPQAGAQSADGQAGGSAAIDPSTPGSGNLAMSADRGA